MKKTVKNYLIISLLLITLVFGGFFGIALNKNYVSADTTAITNDEYGINDYFLYTSLLNIYNQTMPVDQQASQLTVDMFSTYTSLDLSDDSIESLTGLNLLNLSSLTNLNLSNNNLTTTGSSLSNLNLTVLNLSNNDLTSFSYTSLSAGTCVSLIELNLQENLLDSIDLQNLTNATVNLALNDLDNQNEIIFPTSENATVNLTHNLLLGLNLDNVTCQVVGGVQGIKKQSTYTTSAEIEFYNLPDVDTLTILNGSTVLQTLTANQSVTLSIGSYTLKFMDTPTSSLYNSITITIRPTKPTILVNDETVEYSQTISNATTYTFVGEEGATFSYTLNVNGQITTGTGNQVTIDAKGTVYLKVKQTINGISSEYNVLWINATFVTTWGWAYMFLGILFFGVFFYVSKILFVKFAGNKKEDKENLKWTK